RVCLDGVDHEGNQIRRIARRGGESIQRGAPDRRFTGRAHGTDALDLTPFDLGVDAKDVDRSALLGREAIDADDHTPAAIDLLLRTVRGLLNVALDQAALDGGQGSARGVDSIE